MRAVLTKRKIRPRWLALGASALLAAAIVADTTVWTLACNRMERGVAQAAAQARSLGWTVSYGAPTRSGWPFAASLTLPDFAGSGGDEVFPAGLTWSAVAVRLSLGWLHPTTLLVQPLGVQRLGATGLGPVSLDASRAELAFDLRGAPPQAHATDLQLMLPAGRLDIGVAAATFPPDAIEATLTGIRLPDGAGAQVQPPIDRFALQAHLSRPVPPGVVPAERARAWRDAGGQVELSRVSLRWGPLDATGQGTLALDAQLQPRAEASIEATGLPATLDALARSGAIAPTAASAAKAVLAILAAPAPGAPVRVPVQLADGILTVARFPLVRFPPLAWE